MSINGLSRINNTTWTDIIQLLQQDWNPEKISLWLKAERSVKHFTDTQCRRLLYSSWERGLNKNTTGLIRQYLPTSRDFTALTQKQINQVMDKVNNRSRRCPGIKTPNQVLSGINPALALVS